MRRWPNLPGKLRNSDWDMTLEPLCRRVSLIDIDENAVCEAARKERANLRNPPKTVNQLLDGLEKIGLVKTVEFFRRRREFI